MRDELIRDTKIQCGARLEGTTAALPPRKDDRDRRPRRLRRRDRPHLGIRRPLRHQRPSDRVRAWAGTTPAPNRGPGSRRCRRALPHALARSDRRNARRGRAEPAPGRRARRADRAHRARDTIYNASPRGDFRILESYLRAIQGAQQFIYLENQFLWSPEIDGRSPRQAREPPNPDFRLLLLLPPKPNTGADDTRGVLGELIEADDDDGRLLACTLYARCRPLRAIPSTSTQRSRSSTTPGSLSAPPT